MAHISTKGMLGYRSITLSTEQFARLHNAFEVHFERTVPSLISNWLTCTFKCEVQRHSFQGPHNL